MILVDRLGGVIPGEHHETRNPGGIITSKCLFSWMPAKAGMTKSNSSESVRWT